MSTEPNRMDIREFWEAGYLQEANRRFFHPLGLALEVEVDDETGEFRLGGVWDYRDDPEGVLFSPGIIDPNKAMKVGAEMLRKKDVRSRLEGVGADGVQRAEDVAARRRQREEGGSDGE